SGHALVGWWLLVCGNECAEVVEVRCNKCLPFLNTCLLPEVCKRWLRWRYNGLLVRYVCWLCRKHWDCRRFFAIFCMILWGLTDHNHRLLMHGHCGGMRVHL